MAGWVQTPTGSYRLGEARAPAIAKVTGQKSSKGRPSKAPPKAPATKPPGHPHLSKPHGSMGSNGLARRATQLARQEAQPALGQLRTQATEIGQNEQGVQQRYAGYGETTNKILTGLGNEAKEGAKTYENKAADNALKAGKGIETSGQTLGGLTGGYLTPELKAELNAEGTRTAETGGAGKSFAENAGQNEVGYMNNLRAAAAQRILEGHGNISSTYGKQLGLNRAKQGEVTERIGPNAAKIREGLETRAFNQKATEEGLGIKLKGLGQKREETGARLRTTERGQNISKESSERTAGTAKLGREQKARESARRVKEHVEKVSKGGGASPAQLTKLSAELGSAYQGFVSGRAGAGKNPKKALSPKEIREDLVLGKEGKQSFPSAHQQAIITAAQELYYTHKVSTKTRRELGKLGMNIGYDREAYRAVSGH